MVGAGPAGLQAAISAAGQGHRVTVLEKKAEAGGNLRLAASVPNRAEIGDLIRNQLIECARLGVEIRYDTGSTSTWSASLAPDVVVDGHRQRAGSPVLGARRARSTDLRFADVRRGARGHGRPGGLGRGGRRDRVPPGHQRGRSCWPNAAARSRSSPRAWSSARTSGVTLDMEGWLMRAHAKGISMATDLVVVGRRGCRAQAAAPPHRRDAARGSPTGSCWLCPPRAEDTLYTELRDAGIEVHRVGDCVAPRRAHAAVIDGDRIGAAL